MQSFKKYALVPENTISRHIPSVGQMSEMDKEMHAILQNKVLSDYEKVQRYYEVLQKKFSLENYNIPHIAIQESEKYEADKQEDMKQEPIENTFIQLKEMIINSVPKCNRKKAEDLIRLMENHRNIINWNEKGELTYKDRYIENSNLADLFNHILSPLSKSNPIGKNEFLNSLQEMNAPRHYIVNRNIVSHKREISNYDAEREKILSVKKKKRNSRVIKDWISYK